MPSRYSDSVRRVKTADPAIAPTGGVKLPHMGNKSVGAKKNDAARRYVDQLVKDDFGGNVSKTAEAIGISQSMLYDFLHGKRGAGMTLLEGVAQYRRVSIDVVLGNVPDLAVGRRVPLELAAAIAANNFLPETQAMLRLYASLRQESLSQDEWAELGHGYDRENRAAIDRVELRKLRARALPLAPNGAPSTTKKGAR